MLSWAITFLIIAIIAAVLGFGGIAGTATGIAKIVAVRSGIYKRVSENGGCFSAEHGVGPMNAAYYSKYTAPEVQHISRARNRPENSMTAESVNRHANSNSVRVMEQSAGKSESPC